MIERGFRHLLVVNGGELEGILSMRDIVRCWAPRPRSGLARRLAGRLSRCAAATPALGRQALDLLPTMLIQRTTQTTVISSRRRR